MKLTATDGNNFINLDVEPDQLIEDIKALLECQTKIPMDQLQLYLDGSPLKDNQTLSQRGIGEGGLVYFVVGQKPVPKPKKGLGIANMIKQFHEEKKNITEEGYQFQSFGLATFIPEAKKLIQEMKGDKFRLAQMSANHPQLVEGIQKNDVNAVAKIMQQKHVKRIKELKEKERKFLELSKDPMNPQYQKLLQERIHQENIQTNHQFANEYIPEVFGHITMLYINASINKVKIQAFVDSGAQSTIMSVSLAQRCGLMRLVDKRYAGKAMGVGSCKILGRIHAAQMEIEGKFITCSFTVIENNSVQFLLGLDNLRRFSCLIDLKHNTLVFQDGMITTRFLSDSQVDKNKAPVSSAELEVKLKKLTDMGFAKADAAEVLRESGYNQQVASSVLMQRKYGNK